MSRKSPRSESDHTFHTGLDKSGLSNSDMLHDLDWLEQRISAGLELDDDALVSLVVLSGTRPSDPRVRALMQACRNDASLHMRMDAISQRVQHLVEAGTPSREHFERLRAKQPHKDRGPLKGARTWAVRSGVVATVLLVLFIGMSYLHAENRSVHQQLAALETLTSSVPDLHFRSTTASTDELHGYYLAGIQEVIVAEKSVFGLFRRFDSRHLQEAHEQFRVLTILDPDGAVGLEAAYALARIDLHHGDVASAREWLMQVIENQGPSAPEATELLEQLEQF